MRPATFSLLTNFRLIAVSTLAASMLLNAGSTPAATIHTPEGDVPFELVGQAVLNPSPMQYGFLSQIYGIELDSIFSGSPHDASTALFSFFTEAANTQVINNGQLRIVNRVGTTTIYSDPSHGDFANRDSFRDGTPILTAALKQQVILDTFTGTFTATNINTVTSATPFTLGGDQLQLAERGEQFRTSINGRTDSTTPAGFSIAGYAVAIEAVPEPTSLALLGVGAFALLAFGRRSSSDVRLGTNLYWTALV
jgi:hypothetical protein